MKIFSKAHFIRLLVQAMFWLFSVASPAQRIAIPRITEPVTFDGIVNEPFLDSLPTLPFVVHTPVFGKEPSEPSDVWVVYNDEYIFVEARLYDKLYKNIMATSKKRDEISGGNDWFQIIFDSFNDKENALAFATTPVGLRTDYAVFKDGISQLPEMPFNIDWNTFWDVKTSRDEKGWYVEMRIPISSMRFKESEGKVVMGIICIRQIAHLNEVSIFPEIPPNWGPFSILRVSQAREAEFEGIHSKKPFYIAPYIIGGYNQENLLNSTETEYNEEKGPVLNAGLDLKYGLTNNLTLDLTVNTDFAQVEADDEQINLTRFDLFFPEKRNFFQERSSIFAFDFEQGNSLFYSRKIGLSEDEPVPLYGGVRLTGMIKKWDVGLLDMQTHRFNSERDSSHNLPSENFGIVRMRRNVLNKNSYIGAVATSRIGDDGTYNVSYGADAIIKLFENDYLNLKIAQVMTDSANGNPLSLNPTAVFLNWKRFNSSGLGYNFTYGRFGRDYEPGIGFQMRENYSLYNLGVNYGWIRDEKSILQSDNFEITGTGYVSNETGKTESVVLNAGYLLITKSNVFSYQGLLYQYENVTDSFEISDRANVPPGTYSFTMLECHSQTPETNSFFVGMDLFAGSFFDGGRFSITLMPTWNMNSSIQLKTEYEYNRVRFNSRNQKFDGHVMRIRALWMMSTRLSISSFIQYNNAEHFGGANIRFRYNPREGVDFYIVYNEGRNTSLNREMPHLPSLNDRTLQAKFTYTFSARK
jgi:hypothetical protein